MRARRVEIDNGRIIKRRVMFSTRCGKYLYPSKKQAKGHASLSSKMTGEALHAYKCVECHGWHIGHPIGMHGGRR